MIIDAQGMHFQKLNEAIRQTKDEQVTVKNCIGQRYIGSGLSGKTVTVEGTPGNALGAYLDGATVVVKGNAQEATGDTMNDGCICIYGSSGDATGYAMRGGTILVEKNAGYRAGIHMKEYQDKRPVLVIGGQAGSFLGEYQAGGIIVVLGLYTDKPFFSNFCGAGMHGGRMYIRSSQVPSGLPAQVAVHLASQEDMADIQTSLTAFCKAFHVKMDTILAENFYILTPNSKNPYKRLYTGN